MTRSRLTMLNVGDIILGPDPEPYFSEVKSTLQEADLVVGQLEVTHTTRDRQAMELGRHPDHLGPLATNGFDLVTMAGNHLMDAGAAGVEDTIEWLDRHRIAHVGAGMNLEEAKRPVILERGGTRIGYLNYNCVGPKSTWAAADKPGNPYLEIITHYELEHETPGGPPTVYSWATMRTLKAMEDDIRALRPLCDVLVVAFHKGIGHTPAKIAQYEQQVSYAAVDAGADLVVAHHAHILRGAEVYKGKTIYHGLCNFVTWVPLLAPSADKDPDSWAMRRIELFGFEPDPEYPTYPFHPEAVYTMIAKCVIEDGAIVQTGWLPCIIEKSGKPVVLGRDGRGQEVMDYVEKITRKARLNAKYEWAGDEILIRAD
ncbi:CapA family protein [Cohnella caldifontis]|uniref:CapA family protein n=1 Tax=Cohnella caldifontis TaxID=3027471 RepID=UPI0023EB70EB|nr:CapA family protein [Cohnella sp. YIM B05605]